MGCGELVDNSRCLFFFGGESVVLVFKTNTSLFWGWDDLFCVDSKKKKNASLPYVDSNPSIHQILGEESSRNFLGECRSGCKEWGCNMS